MGPKTFVVGDIHGYIDKLEKLLTKLPINWDLDKLVFLGDYVDRGPYSRHVVDLIINLRKKHGERIICLKGNHEEMFINFLTTGTMSSIFLLNGGKKTLESYGIKDSHKGCGLNILPPEHVEFFSNLKTHFELEKFFMVHAGVRPNIPLDRQKEEDMLWIRTEFIHSDFDWGKRIIFGHTTFETPFIKENKIGIDTGAGYGKNLTCLILPHIEFIFA